MAVRRGQWQKNGKNINACEVWIWRKMQRISWTEKKTNENVRMEIGIEEDETLQQTAIRRKLGCFWTCYEIRWIGKRNYAGMRREKEEERAKKEKTGMKLAELYRRRDEGKETTEKA